jgi:hypothetical protein
VTRGPGTTGCDRSVLLSRSLMRPTVRLEGSSAHTNGQHPSIRRFLLFLEEALSLGGSPHPPTRQLSLGATHDCSHLHSVWCHRALVFPKTTQQTKERAPVYIAVLYASAPAHLPGECKQIMPHMVVCVAHQELWLSGYCLKARSLVPPKGS